MRGEALVLLGPLVERRDYIRIVLQCGGPDPRRELLGKWLYQSLAIRSRMGRDEEASHHWRALWTLQCAVMTFRQYLYI